MVYQGLGTGNILERNEKRIQYVQSLSKADIELLVDNIFLSLDNNDNDIDYYIKKLFYEQIESKIINKLIRRHQKLTEEQKETLKNMIKEKCIQRSERGFVWNFYNLLM